MQSQQQAAARGPRQLPPLLKVQQPMPTEPASPISDTRAMSSTVLTWDTLPSLTRDNSVVYSRAVRGSRERSVQVVEHTSVQPIVPARPKKRNSIRRAAAAARRSIIALCNPTPWMEDHKARVGKC
jgi:hypothetical protein